jgi:Fe-S oxidoreductase
MDPVAVEVFGVPGYVIFWIAALVAFWLFGRRVTILIGLLRKAQPENRTYQFGKRLQLFFVNVLAQKRLFYEYLIGGAHFLIFWSFILFAGTFAWNLPRWLFPFLPMPYADEIPIIRFLFVVMSVVGLLAVAFAAVRRVFFPPPHLQKTWDANIILALISLVLLTTLFGMVFKAGADAATGEQLIMFDKILATTIPQLSVNSAERLYVLMFWLHQLVVLGFLAYLPYSKHLHLLASPFNVFFGNVRPAGNLSDGISDERRIAGASKWDEFTWRQLFNAFSCAECGRCDRACPALNSGYSLSPRLVIHSVKEHLLESGLKKKNGTKKSEETEKSLIGGYITEADLWACTTCYSCVDRCPVFNEHVSLIVSMRRYLVGQGSVSKEIEETLVKYNRYGNSFGQSDRARPKWTQGLDFTIKDARKEPVEYLWWVGDYASFDARLQNITQTTARLFRHAGLDFGLVYEAERNTGNDLRRIGEEGLFELLKDKNLQTLDKAQFHTIVTTDPHVYNTLKNEYGLSGSANGKNGNGAGRTWNVKHYTEVLDDLIKQGKLKLSRKQPHRVTYHDPCYLGRYNGIYDAPRRVLQTTGAQLTEMPRNGAKSYCCGAGGGRIWMQDSAGIKERPSESRVREAVLATQAEVMVVACPKDVVMFQDAVKTTGNETKIIVRDISELVWEALEH